MFEGTPQQFWTSLSRLRSLPDDMRVYCAHEYTQSNARFAVTVETDNSQLMARRAAVDAARARGEATVPSLLGEEKQTNPFLRADLPGVQKAVGMVGKDPALMFAEVRHRKDVFRSQQLPGIAQAAGVIASAFRNSGSRFIVRRAERKGITAIF